MADKLATSFLHRHIWFGPWRSLCLKCCQTVATARTQAALAESEAAHACAGLYRDFKYHPPQPKA